MTLLNLPLAPLERALLGSLQRLDHEASESVLAAAALACMLLNNGDVCLVLSRWAGQRPWGEGYTLPPLAQWRAELLASQLVGAPGAFAHQAHDAVVVVVIVRGGFVRARRNRHLVERL